MTLATTVIFTDLDGTLLDRDTYSFAAAQPALDAVRRQQLPLILNSSKTVAEISALRRQLDNHHPFVVENGAAVYLPENYFRHQQTCAELTPAAFASEPLACRHFGQSYNTLIEALDDARQQGFQFTGFADMCAAELADITGLSVEEAALAKQRSGTEPLLFAGDDNVLARFRDWLAQRQLKLVTGGRFHHVMGQYDKAAGVCWLLAAYQREASLHGIKQPLRSIALGDSHNDIGMLNSVDIAVVIKSPHSNDIVLEPTHTVIRSAHAGPEGWNNVMLELLNPVTEHG